VDEEQSGSAENPSNWVDQSVLLTQPNRKSITPYVERGAALDKSITWVYFGTENSWEPTDTSDSYLQTFTD
jgi:hypothetical protein